MASLVEKRCACAEARWPKCADPWYLRKYRHQGQAYEPNLTRYARVVLGRAEPLEKRADAEHVAGKVIDAIVEGTYVPAKGHRPAPVKLPVTSDLTLDALCQKFDAGFITVDAVKKPNSKTNDRAHLKRLRRTDVDGERLGARAAADVTLGDLIAFRAEQEGISVSTWNKIRTVLGQLFDWAHYAGHLTVDLLHAAPRAQRKLLGRGKGNRRQQRIRPVLWGDLLEAALRLKGGEGPRFRDFLIALVETAVRPGELLALQWRDVYRAEGYFDIRATEALAGKTGFRRVVISATLDAILAARGLDPAGRPWAPLAYMFGDPYGARVKRVGKAWGMTVLRAHGIAPTWTPKGDFDPATRAVLAELDLHLYDLRHEGACRWLTSGCFDLAQISERLGHATIAQTATYLHAASGSIPAAQAAYDQKRTAEAAAARAAAAQLATGPDPGESVGKLSANAALGSAAAGRPRLVKGRKSQSA